MRSGLEYSCEEVRKGSKDFPGVASVLHYTCVLSAFQSSKKHAFLIPFNYTYGTLALSRVKGLIKSPASSFKQQLQSTHQAWAAAFSLQKGWRNSPKGDNTRHSVNKTRALEVAQEGHQAHLCNREGLLEGSNQRTEMC